MTIFGLFAQLISGLASPAIFVPSFVIGWFVRRWWQVLIGAVLVAVVSDAEVMLIEMPDAKPDWSTESLGFIAPLCWCAAVLQCVPGLVARYSGARRKRCGPCRSSPA
jgi:hypothetical protein